MGIFGDIFSEIEHDVGDVARFGLDTFKETQAIPLSIIGGGFGLANNVGGKLAGGVGGAVNSIGGGLGQIGGGLGSALQYLPLILIAGGGIFLVVQLKNSMK